MTPGRITYPSALAASVCLAMASSSFGVAGTLEPDERGRAMALAASLPPPTHPVDLAYYGAEWKGLDSRAEVREFTTLDMVRVIHYSVADADDPQWTTPLARSLAEAAEAGRRIYLGLDQNHDFARLSDVLDAAASHWDGVAYVELADEPDWDAFETAWRVGQLRSELALRGLSPKPVGIVYTRDEVLQGLPETGLDWIGIECYLDPPGSPLSQSNIEALHALIRRAKAAIPPSTRIVLVMMAYDRNGAWRNVGTLADLQIPVYLEAFDDPRVAAVTMFAYGRRGGARDHSELRVRHRAIGDAVGRFTPERVVAEAGQEEGEAAQPADARALDDPGPAPDLTPAEPVHSLEPEEVRTPRPPDASPPPPLALALPRENRTPEVSIRVEASCHPPCVATFQAESRDEDGDRLSYAWSGCATGTGPKAVCAVGGLGEVEATVAVTDGRATVRSSAAVTGVNAPPRVLPPAGPLEIREDAGGARLSFRQSDDDPIGLAPVACEATATGAVEVHGCERDRGRWVVLAALRAGAHPAPAGGDRGGPVPAGELTVTIRDRWHAAGTLTVPVYQRGSP